MAYNRVLFFNSVRQNPFGGTMSNDQVAGMDALLDYIDHLKWWPSEDTGSMFHFWNSYCFATAYHETARTMQPITELGSSAYLQGKRYWPYIGRGFVQLTWETNYKRSDKEIATGKLVSQETLNSLPNGVVNQHGIMDQALNLEVAACNLMVGSWRGWYTGKKLWDYLKHDTKDYWNARRIINGTDKATQIAKYAESFENAFRGAWQTEEIPVEPPDLPPSMPPPDTQPTVTITISEAAAWELVSQLREQLDLSDAPEDIREAIKKDRRELMKMLPDEPG